MKLDQVLQRELSDALRAVTEWIDEYRATVGDRPVQPALEFGTVLAALEQKAPIEGAGLENLLGDFKEKILPAMTHWQHPRFFAYFPSQASDASLLAELIVAAMGAQCMSWVTSPAATEVEIRTLEWLRDSLGLPSEYKGCIQDSASNATLAVMVAARERATQFASNELGARDFDLVAYCSEEAHSSVEKAAKIMGLGRKNLRKIAVDENLAMRADALEAAITSDRQAGRLPFFVVGALGTTGTTAIDPLARISEIAQRFNLWHHVDAAYAGSLLLLPELRAIGAGVNSADSIVFNPHKWMRCHFDCSTLFLRDAQTFVDTFAILPEYLKTNTTGEMVNFRDWGLGLGRRFRALKLYFVFRAYGLSGIQAGIRNDLARAAALEARLRAASDVELLAPRSMNLLCFRFLAPGATPAGLDAMNERILSRVNATGTAYFTHTKVHDRYAIRWVLGQLQTQDADIDLAWEVLMSAARYEISLGS